MNQITIEVSPAVARAYQSASFQDRKRIQAIVTLILQKPEDRELTFLQEIMNDISDRASERGLTPAILQSILHED
ncbi:MAG: hypothetical protein SWY16_00710 [Cyanobacteriota bacterium]|nr:hypothetical protein [Cyanobacteriota bacterium]